MELYYTVLEIIHLCNSAFIPKNDSLLQTSTTWLTDGLSEGLLSRNPTKARWPLVETGRTQLLALPSSLHSQTGRAGHTGFWGAEHALDMQTWEVQASLYPPPHQELTTWV